jgi:hypothetical protein
VVVSKSFGNLDGFFVYLTTTKEGFMYKLQRQYFGGFATFVENFTEFDTFDKALDYVMNNKPPTGFEWNVRENGQGDAIIWTKNAGEEVWKWAQGEIVNLRKDVQTSN